MNCLRCDSELKKEWQTKGFVYCCQHCDFNWDTYDWTTNVSETFYLLTKGGTVKFAPRGCLAIFNWTEL